MDSYYDENSMPTFFHGRNPRIISSKKEKRTSIKSIKTPRRPLDQVAINRLFQDYTYHKHLRKKLNLKQSLIKHVAYQQDLEESLTYNYLEVFFNNRKPIDVILLDTSYSMKHLSKKMYSLFDDMSCDVFLYHDVDIFDYSFIKKDKIEFLGGTSHAFPLTKLLNVSNELNVVLNVSHISDGEISNRDRHQSLSIISHFISNNNNYQLINLK